jgi:chromosomal replication initiation ATPase DnaA
MRELLQRLALLEEMEAVCQRYHVLLDWVLVGIRRKTVVEAREECCAVLRAKGMSYQEIGTALATDHTTVISAVRRWRRRNGQPPPAGKAGT